MIYRVAWQDQQGVDRGAYCDDKESAVQIQNAMRADRRICVMAPSVNPMEVDDGSIEDGDERGETINRNG